MNAEIVESLEALEKHLGGSLHDAGAAVQSVRDFIKQEITAALAATDPPVTETETKESQT